VYSILDILDTPVPSSSNEKSFGHDEYDNIIPSTLVCCMVLRYIDLVPTDNKFLNVKYAMKNIQDCQEIGRTIRRPKYVV
jgi:hypothetical protein